MEGAACTACTVGYPKLTLLKVLINTTTRYVPIGFNVQCSADTVQYQYSHQNTSFQVSYESQDAHPSPTAEYQVDMPLAKAST